MFLTNETVFRVVFSIFWVIFIVSAAWVRYSSRVARGKSSTGQTLCEKWLRTAGVILFAPLWWGGIILYIIVPGWIMFLSIPLPEWFRSTMACVAALSLPFTLWGYHTLGRNWVHGFEPSKFIQDKNETLVTNGPYKYVRNPIYLGAFIFVIALALLAANWLLLLPTLAIVAVLYNQIGGEEVMLMNRFGAKYREYMVRTPRLIPNIMQKHLPRPNDRQVNIDVFRNPSKYLKRLPLDEIVADARVYREGVERYKEKIAKGENLPPIVVVKHPAKDVYAVLDGHHRYYAYLELGRKEIDCALAGNISGVIFHLTEHGVFQPPSGLTEHIRVPAFEFNAKVKQFLSDFSKDPHKIQNSADDHITTTHP